MAGTVNVLFDPFFSLNRIEPLFPKALEVLLELASQTNLHFSAVFHQLRREFNRDIHEGIELWVHWEDERFAAIYLRTSPEPATMMVRDYQFPRGQDDRRLPWTTAEEGIVVLATFLEPVIVHHESFLGQSFRTLQQLKKLHPQEATA